MLRIFLTGFQPELEIVCGCLPWRKSLLQHRVRLKPGIRCLIGHFLEQFLHLLLQSFHPALLFLLCLFLAELTLTLARKALFTSLVRFLLLADFIEDLLFLLCRFVRFVFLQIILLLLQGFLLKDQCLLTRSRFLLRLLCRCDIFLCPYELFPHGHKLTIILVGSQAALCDSRTIAIIIYPADTVERRLLTPELFNRKLRFLHILHGLGQWTQIFLRKRRQRCIEDFIDDTRLEIPRELRAPKLNQELHEFLIFIRIFKAEDMLIDHPHIFPLIRRHAAILPDTVLQLLT